MGYDVESSKEKPAKRYSSRLQKKTRVFQVSQSKVNLPTLFDLYQGVDNHVGLKARDEHASAPGGAEDPIGRSTTAKIGYRLSAVFRWAWIANGRCGLAGRLCSKHVRMWTPCN